MNEVQQIKNIMAYEKAIPNINKACSSVIENSLAIFLPMTRIDKSNVYKTFMRNNQILEIENDLFDRVEIRGRLLGQIHKDILESLLTMPKTFSMGTAQFKIKTSAYKILQKMQRHTGDKQWLIQKVHEIKECGINLHYKNSNGKGESFNFGFISGIKIVDKTNIEVWFSPEYTHFLAHNELLNYADYVPQIISLHGELKLIQEQIGIKRGLNSEFIKAVVRYMLIHNGKNSKIRIENLIKKLNLEKIMSTREIKVCVIDLKRKEVVELLEKNFGITLISENETIIYNSPENKNKYFIQKALDF